MAKVIIHRDTLRFYCQGCKKLHYLDLRYWKFNNDVINPTVIPSAIVNSEQNILYNKLHHTCCFMIKNGLIMYSNEDTTHELAGRLIPLLDVEIKKKIKYKK